MIEFNVPLHTQDPDSQDCGPMSSLMVLDYFGKTSDRAAIIKQVPRLENGTSTFANAEILKSYGLDVTIVTANPLLFDGGFLKSNPTEAALVERITQALENETTKDKQHNLYHLLLGLKKGVTLAAERPTKQMIVEALQAQKLVWASTYARALGDYTSTYHAIVLAGYNDADDTFLVMDPWPDSPNKSWESAEAVIFAIHVCTLFEYDNGAIILVGDPKNG